MGVMMPWRKRSDDELISAFIDGQLDDNSRQAFEARIGTEPALRRRVDATRQLIALARETPQIAVPHNFTLPREPQIRQSSATAPRLLWRVSSVLAAAVFVLAIGLDTLGLGQLAPSTLQVAAPAPRAAQSFAVKAPEPTQNNATQSAKALPDAANGAIPTEPATAAPAATSAPPAAARMATTSTPSTDALAAPTVQPKALSEPVLTPTLMAATEPARIPVITTFQLPVGAPVAEQTASASSELLRIVALLALTVAVVAGFVGWVRR